MIQLQVLNYLLDTGDSSILLMNNLSDEYFSKYKKEYEFIKNHLNAYGKIPDKETFLGEFPDFDIIKVNESSHYLLDALYEDRNKRFLASAFNSVRNLMLEGKTDEAMKVLTYSSEQAVQATHLDAVDIFKDKSRYEDYVKKIYDFSTYYVSTGFKELDDIIGGWDRKEELATIAARTNQGKSWILDKCALAAAKQGLIVGMYSGEMSVNKVGYRIDTLDGHISNSKLTHGIDSIQNEYKNYLDNLNIKGTIKVLTPAMIDGPAGVTALRAFIEKEHLDMLCIDQHSLLDDDRHAKNPIERAANISRDLKNLQVLKKIPIISVSQQNRTSTENGVNTEHIAQSDRIAQDSTIILFFEQKDGVLTLHLVKSRDSANMKDLKYVVDFDKGLFQYLPDSEDALDGNTCEELKEEFASEDIF